MFVMSSVSFLALLLDIIRIGEDRSPVFFNFGALFSQTFISEKLKVWIHGVAR